MKKQLKIAAVAALLAVGFTANAQVKTDQTDNSKDITAKSNATLGKADGAVKVIDNKGTIKYLQSNNGITTFTNFDPSNGGEITTWQLGGELKVDTEIKFGAKGATDQTSFTLDGEKFILKNIEQATGEANEFDNTTGAVTKTNWEVLVREGVDGTNEGTVRKVALTELLKVQGFHNVVTATAANQTSKTVEITVAGLPATVNPYKIWVYRNGAKLQSGTDYTFTAGKVTVDGTATGGDFPIYENDKIEIHYIK